MLERRGVTMRRLSLRGVLPATVLPFRSDCAIDAAPPLEPSLRPGAAPRPLGHQPKAVVRASLVANGPAEVGQIRTVLSGSRLLAEPVRS
jgi:hypothetical protein